MYRIIVQRYRYRWPLLLLSIYYFFRINMFNFPTGRILRTAAKHDEPAAWNLLVRKAV